MLKSVIAGTAALTITGFAIAYAQQPSAGQEGYAQQGTRVDFRHRLSADDMAALGDARVAALKAGLELTPDQMKNWPPFEQALRDVLKLRIERWQARMARRQQDQSQAATTTPFDRLAHRADAMAKTSAALKSLAEAGTPLYQSLTEAQKGRFTMLAHMLRPHRGMGGERFGGWRSGEGHDGRWFRHNEHRPSQDGNRGGDHGSDDGDTQL